MRGEESVGAPAGLTPQELPPHARRRELAPCDRRDDEGITSACAEKSLGKYAQARPGGNYLRMRGEEGVELPATGVQGELPPHARRREMNPLALSPRQGITSACAEKSFRW